MDLTDLRIPYLLPTALLMVALIFKAPTLARAWRDPDVRATTLLLGLATAVFVSVTPVSIHEINTMTGIPNIAAPWGYSLLTAFCATCLTMIMRWRDEPSNLRRRRMHRVYLIYSGIVLALWITFLLADVPEERIYDLDTYYAGTPWIREHILLYLIAHMASALVAASMLWRWLSEVESRWLKTGLVFLQMGYAFGLVFDVAKLTAVAARWADADWDFLSTRVAPPFALLDAILVAIGFIVPQAGPYLQDRIRDGAHHRRLRPLWHTLRMLAPAAAQARVGRWAPIDLRLLQRQQRIHDALLRLAPHLDYHLYARAYVAASARHDGETARGIAGAVTIQVAAATYRQPASADTDADPEPTANRPALIKTEITDHIDAISRAMRRTRATENIRLQATIAESVTPHA
ncbi:MAB_1171c family putative transporter [Streptomyces lavendulae]|uniref:MAB_1171c family putative transporter n=1 Tax=Streptomyces lavendulae TaxID=1914 RepID=UPI0033DD0CEB